MNSDREFSLAPGERERIETALDQLEQDDHAPREISVRVVLNVFKEYPKAVEGQTVNSRAEERALLEKLAAEKKAAEPPAENAGKAAEPNALQLGAEIRRLGLTGDKPSQPAASEAGTSSAPVLQTMETKLPGVTGLQPQNSDQGEQAQASDQDAGKASE